MKEIKIPLQNLVAGIFIAFIGGYLTSEAFRLILAIYP